MFDFYRAATCVPPIKVGDTEYNLKSIQEKLEECSEYSPAVIAFPELALTGYCCQDLFLQDTLIKASNKAAAELIKSTIGRREVIIVGAPIKIDNNLFNGALVMMNGRLLGVSIKTYIPNHGEFYEKRWFNSATELVADSYETHDLGIMTEESY